MRPSAANPVGGDNGRCAPAARKSQPARSTGVDTIGSTRSSSLLPIRTRRSRRFTRSAPMYTSSSSSARATGVCDEAVTPAWRWGNEKAETCTAGSASVDARPRERRVQAVFQNTASALAGIDRLRSAPRRVLPAGSAFPSTPRQAPQREQEHRGPRDHRGPRSGDKRRERGGDEKPAAERDEHPPPDKEPDLGRCELADFSTFQASM